MSISKQQIARGWLPHDGKKCPVGKDARVQVLLRDHREPSGSFTQGVYAPAGGWCWDIDPSKTGAIIGYKLEQPQ